MESVMESKSVSQAGHSPYQRRPRQDRVALVVGLTGSIGAGKSTLAQWLAKQGAVVIDADRLGHQALTHSGVVASVARRFGSHLVVNGVIDRRKLGEIVFHDPEARTDLEAMVHPMMKSQAAAAIDAALKRDDCTLVILDAALLFEAGWNDLCHKVLNIDAHPSIRYERLGRRDGRPVAESILREKAQWTAESKDRFADATIRNDGLEIGCQREAAELLQQWASESDSHSTDMI